MICGTSTTSVAGRIGCHPVKRGGKLVDDDGIFPRFPADVSPSNVQRCNHSAGQEKKKKKEKRKKRKSKEKERVFKCRFLFLRSSQ